MSDRSSAHAGSADGGDGFRPAPATVKPGFVLLETLNGASRFMPDIRFGPAAEVPPPEPEPESELVEDLSDPVLEAYREGHADGFRQAMEQVAAAAEVDDAVRTRLSLSFERLDALLEEELRMRLSETVAALCEAAIAPLAIDEAALLRRIGAAVSMLARADDERVIRLHPEDIAMLAPKFAQDWHVQPDPQLERGTIRVESTMGGVEDGPTTWRLAIAEALQQC